jgi:urocanate hydratase
VIEPPGVHVEVGGGHPLTVEQARRLAVVVMAAADSLARLAPDPAHPLDAYSLPAIVDHLTRRISGPGALRHALASTDPADLTPADRDTMLELIQQSERLEFEAMMARRAAKGLR